MIQTPHMGRGLIRRSGERLLEGRRRRLPQNHAAPDPAPAAGERLIVHIESMDHQARLRLDLVPYLEQAEDEEIRALDDCDWQGAGEIAFDSVLGWLSPRNEDFEALLDYCENNKQLMVWSVRAEAAREWIRVNRPAVHVQIN